MIFWLGRSDTLDRGRSIAAAMRPRNRFPPPRLEAINHPLETGRLPSRGFTRFWSRPGQTRPQQTLKAKEGSVAQQAALVVERVSGAEPVIDLGHLARMTFGNRSLERELLELFDRQACMLIERMRASDAPVVATLAHTLKGSASGIGASSVACAARAAELAADGAAAECSAAIDRLAAAIEEARALIAELLRAQ